MKKTITTKKTVQKTETESVTICDCCGLDKEDMLHPVLNPYMVVETNPPTRRRLGERILHIEWGDLDTGKSIPKENIDYLKSRVRKRLHSPNDIGVDVYADYGCKDTRDICQECWDNFMTIEVKE